ncbi:MAG: response regulator [Bacteroidota bacterium]
MPDVKSFKRVSILLIEDDEGHARLIEKNLRRAGIHNTIVHAKDGQEGMDLIFGERRKEIPTESILILLDLNLPIYHGMQILERIRSTEETKNTPVIVLTTTDDEDEMRRCYELGCNVYITKPVNYTLFSEAIRKIGLLFSVIMIPKNPVSSEAHS